MVTYSKSGEAKQGYAKLKDIYPHLVKCRFKLVSFINYLYDHKSIGLLLSLKHRFNQIRCLIVFEQLVEPISVLWVWVLDDLFGGEFGSVHVWLSKYCGRPSGIKNSDFELWVVDLLFFVEEVHFVPVVVPGGSLHPGVNLGVVGGDSCT